VTNKNDGKKYVGQTMTTIERRWQVHCYLALIKNGKTHLYNAIRRDGKNAFELELLRESTCTQRVADEIECVLISALKTNMQDVGYNMTGGGNTKDVVVFTPEMCAKISASKRGKPIVARRLKTQEEDRPIVELFKMGKTRREIETILGVSKGKVQKALARWKERVEPDLNVGREHQYVNSSQRLQKNWDEINRPIIDLFHQGLKRKEIASCLGITYCKVVTAIQRYHRRQRAAE
jgi:group I intron endonuclease